MVVNKYFDKKKTHFISVSMYLQESTNWEVDSDHQNPQPLALQSSALPTELILLRILPKSRISFDPGLHNNRRKKRAFCHMSLNKRLLILKKGKPDYSRMTPFFSGLNATEKCKCNETFKKRVVSHIHKVFTYVWKECKVAYQLKG